METSKKDQLRLWFHVAAFSRMQLERKKKKVPKQRNSEDVSKLAKEESDPDTRRSPAP